MGANNKEQKTSERTTRQPPSVGWTADKT